MAKYLISLSRFTWRGCVRPCEKSIRISTRFYLSVASLRINGCSNPWRNECMERTRYADFEIALGPVQAVGPEPTASINASSNASERQLFLRRRRSWADQLLSSRCPVAADPRGDKQQSIISTPDLPSSKRPARCHYRGMGQRTQMSALGNACRSTHRPGNDG